MKYLNLPLERLLLFFSLLSRCSTCCGSLSCLEATEWKAALRLQHGHLINKQDLFSVQRLSRWASPDTYVALLLIYPGAAVTPHSWLFNGVRSRWGLTLVARVGYSTVAVVFVGVLPREVGPAICSAVLHLWLGPKQLQNADCLCSQCRATACTSGSLLRNPAIN